MGQINVIIKTLFGVLIMAGCLMFVINVFFFSETENGIGLFGRIGTSFSSMIGNASIENEGAGHMQEVVNYYIPAVEYNGGALKQGDCVVFKSLLSVKLENGTTVSGSTENGFALYLIDIRTSKGNSVLEEMRADNLVNMEEIPATFVYDKETDMLYIFGSGTFTVFLKIYSDAGGAETYEFQLPVEF